MLPGVIPVILVLQSAWAQDSAATNTTGTTIINPYECTNSDPISIVLEGPHHNVVIQSQSFPSYPNTSDPLSRCQWRVTALNGAKVRVTALEVELAEDCISSSVLSMSDESDMPHLLHYPGVEARCNQMSTIPSSESCLTAEGALVITSTHSLRHRLLLEATTPYECPKSASEDYCPEGPCCGDDRCTCQYMLGTQPLEIQSSKPGLCSIELISPPGSQVSLNFLEMQLPPTDPAQGCEDWVGLEETGKYLSSVIASQKFCGSAVPNYPGPSVLTAGTNSLTVSYFINQDSLNHGHGFRVAATAVNPLCAAQTYHHSYGESECMETCGIDSLPPGPQEVYPCPPDPPVPCPECFTTVTPPCQPPPEKVVVLIITQNGTETPIPGAEVNITSPSSFFPHRSNAEGVVSSQGLRDNASLTISVAAEGFISQQHMVMLDCVNLECQDCETSLSLVMDTVPPPEKNETCPTNMTWSITVIDSTKQPVPDVTVSLIYITENSTEQIVAENIQTDPDTGKVTVPITVNGEYKATLDKEGWLSKVVDVTIENCTHDEQEEELEKEVPCNGTLEIHVRDYLDTPLPNAKVYVYLPGQEDALSFSPLIADENGDVKHTMTPGLLKIKVEAVDYYTKEVDLNLTCERGVIRIEMDPVPTTLAPTCYDPNAPIQIVLTVSVFDQLNLDPISGAQANVSLDGQYILATEASIGETWGIALNSDGMYEVTVMADGYETTTGSIQVECDPTDCGNCTPSLEIPLKQNICTDDKCCGDDMNILNVEIRDSNTLALVPGAQVTVELKVGDGSRPVSPYLECAEESVVAPDCGYTGINQDGCIASHCCWTGTQSINQFILPVANRQDEVIPTTTAGPSTDGWIPSTTAATTTSVNTTEASVATTTVTVTSSQCSLKVGETEITTDASGRVSTPLPGAGEYTIKVSRPGFEPLEYTYTAPLHPESCNPINLALAITQEIICDPEGLPFHLTVLDNSTSLPLPETIIKLILTYSALGASQVQVGGRSLTTDMTGRVSPTLYTSGTYRVEAMAAGYLDFSEEFRVSAPDCEEGGINITLHLIPKPVPEPPCDIGTDIGLTVYDKYTGVPVSGVFVDVSYEGNSSYIVAQGVSTDEQGTARIPVSILGIYVATLSNASIPPYLAAATSINKTCCTCPATLVLYLDQPHCDPVMNISVTDKTTGLPIPEARVSLLLTHSLSGPSLVVEGDIVITDFAGIAALHPEINGNYSVKVEAENYLPEEAPIFIDCDPMNCEGCHLQVEVHPQEEFCTNRTLKLVVKDSTNNEPLVGALAHIVQETHLGPNSIGVFTVNSEGLVLLPLIGNGHYTTTLYQSGYMNLTTTLRVHVTQEQCELLAPMELVPMSPPPEPGCVRLSLTWGEKPKDLDLYSYRVEQNNTEESCLTYYCDGKDPCDGVDFDVDNQEGGEGGSETITYCNVEEYSHMVWVDDRSGLGASLLNSEARLVIIAESGQTQEVVLRTAEDQEPGARYWLAGCLTTTESSFEFLSLNQFTSASPDVEQPLHCHTRTSLENNPTPPSADIHVWVATTQGEPLPDVVITLTTSHERYSKVTGEDGHLEIPVTEDGYYSVLAQLENYVPERLNFSLYCEGVEGQCGTNVRVTMMSLEEDGALRIKLNWDGLGRDLDLHLLQVESDEPREVCQTYWNNMGSCPDTELDQNVGMEGTSTESSLAETITVYNLAAKSHLSFMVFVDDNTATGANLSIVHPQLTMTQGSKVVTAQMPSLPNAHAGARYWLAGAIEVVGTSFRWVPAVAWFMETPNNKPEITVDNLLDQPVDGEPSFCEGIKFKVSVIDSLTNQPLEATTATILRVESGEEQVISEGAVTDEHGEIYVDISQGGHYEVQVTGAGYVTTRKSLNVDCAPAYCTVCAPSLLVPLSPYLGQDQLRLTLGGCGCYLDNLDIYAVYRDSSSICATTPTVDTPTSCPGVDKVSGKDGNGVETITFNQPSGDTPAVYTVFVEWTAPVGIEEASFADSYAWVTLTDGVITEYIQMEADVYGGERHWLAGCLLMGGNNTDPAFKLIALNKFFTERPDEEVPDVCLEIFGLKKTGKQWNGQCVKDKKSRVLPVSFGQTGYNTPDYCIEKCRSHEYSYAGVEYSSECYCGHTPPVDEILAEDEDCDQVCSGDSTEICGGAWRINVYETGYDSGLAMTPGKSCDCSYTLGGCKVSSPPPAGYACNCKYQGYWTCGATLKHCDEGADCPADCTSKTCCQRGGGDCGGYWG